MIQDPISPVVRAIYRDKRLTNFDRTVFMVVAQRLDFVEYRELTLASVARDVGDGSNKTPGRSSIHRSLRRLTAAGYLHRDTTGGVRGTGRYRLRFSVLVSARSDKTTVPLGATVEAAKP
jgi:DNA-binding IclR family transcriptional regulator